MRTLSAVWVGVGTTFALTAHAHEPARPSASTTKREHTLLVGAGLGGRSQRLTIDGRRTPRAAEGGMFGVDGEAGYLRAVTRRLALGAFVRGGSFGDQWAAAVGERRTRLELRLSPEVSLPFAEGRSERPEVTAGVGFGPTVVWIQPPARDAVVERYDPAVGFHAALRVGVSARLLGSVRCYYVMEGAFRRVSTDRTAFVRASTPRVWERYRFDDYSLGAVLGIALPL
jgi:hypothetical protein